MARGSVSIYSWIHCTSRSLPPMQSTRQVLFQCECFCVNHFIRTDKLVISLPVAIHLGGTMAECCRVSPCLGLPWFKAFSRLWLGLFLFNSGYLPSYLLPTYLLTYLHTYCLPTYLSTHIPAYLPTYLHTYLPTYLPYPSTYFRRFLPTPSTCLFPYVPALVLTFLVKLTS